MSFSLKEIFRRADRRKIVIAKADIEAKRILEIRKKRREQQNFTPAS